MTSPPPGPRLTPARRRELTAAAAAAAVRAGLLRRAARELAGMIEDSETVDGITWRIDAAFGLDHDMHTMTTQLLEQITRESP